jgi:hypothetical protein
LLHDWPNFGVFPRDLPILIHIGGHIFAAHQVIEFGQPGSQLVELVLHARFHGRLERGSEEDSDQERDRKDARMRRKAEETKEGR